jgi:uncharacterized PurR-regulated membrane protein YhhQ (DUF165 family)
VLLHVALVVLLYVFLLRALADALARVQRGTAPTAPSKADDWIETWGAFCGAALFAVHPLMTEAVGYVSGRSEVLCGVFFLAALLLGRFAMLQTSAAPRHERSRVSFRTVAAVFGAVLCGLLALLSKEVGVTLPFVMLAYDWIVLPGLAEARKRRLWVVFAPTFIAAVAVAAYRLLAVDVPVAALGRPPLLTLLTQSIVIWRYAGLLFAPVGQSIMHSAHEVTTFTDVPALIALAGLVAIIIVALRFRRVAPLVTFGLIWFFAVLAPSSSIFALREAMAEHRAYFASIGIIMALSAATMEAFASNTRRGERVPAWYRAAFAAVLGVLSFLTAARNEVWGSRVGVWREAGVVAEGMWEPHYALGDALREAGDCVAAVPSYEAALRLRPHDRDVQTNLGICLAQIGRFDDAEAAFRRALEIDPRFARSYTNLGALAMVRGQPERARDFYLQAISVDPDNVLARMQLARLYENTFHDYHAAARMCGEARAIAPTTAGVIDCVERNQRQAALKGRGR